MSFNTTRLVAEMLVVLIHSLLRTVHIPYVAHSIVLRKRGTKNKYRSKARNG